MLDLLVGLPGCCDPLVGRIRAEFASKFIMPTFSNSETQLPCETGARFRFDLASATYFQNMSQRCPCAARATFCRSGNVWQRLFELSPARYLRLVKDDVETTKIQMQRLVYPPVVHLTFEELILTTVLHFWILLPVESCRACEKC